MKKDDWRRRYLWLALTAPPVPVVLFVGGGYLFWTGWLQDMSRMLLVLALGAGSIVGLIVVVPALLISGGAAIVVGYRRRSRMRFWLGVSGRNVASTGSIGASSGLLRKNS